MTDLEAWIVCPDCRGWLELKDASPSNPDGIPCPTCLDSDLTGMIPLPFDEMVERIVLVPLDYELDDDGCLSMEDAESLLRAALGDR